MGADLLIPLLIFLSVTGIVLALTSLTGRPAGRVRVRILSPAGDGPLAPAPGAFQLPAEGTRTSPTAGGASAAGQLNVRTNLGLAEHPPL